MTLTILCKELKNWFCIDRHFGTFEIVNGTLTIPSLKEGQFFRIVGSVFNDGVHQYPASDLQDEEFDGAIWEMAVPQEIIDLSEEISNWESENAKVLNSPYQSESFGGYSYSKESGSGTNGVITWQSHFASSLNRWRKI